MHICFNQCLPKTILNSVSERPVENFIIMKDLIKLMQPKYIEVFGEFTPRGGIAIHPYANYGAPDTPYAELARRRLFDYRGVRH